MKEHYQICEDKTTYLLEIDHAHKTFAVGSVKGKVNIPGYRPVDTSAYKEQIRRIGVEYAAISNSLPPPA